MNHTNLAKARFVTIEGTEGAGKSTNIEVILNYLDEQGIPYIHTREPGGTPLAEDIRELLLAPRDEAVNQYTELLLVFAARAQHIAQVIKPALAEGKWVICDRFTDATYAYQGAGRGLDVAAIDTLKRLVQQDLQPDMTLLLDLPVELGMSRAKKRGALDRFESEKIAFFERIRSSYLQAAAAEKDRFHIVDAAQALDQVKAQVKQAIEALVEAVDV